MSRVVTRFDAPDPDVLLRPRSYPVPERPAGEGIFEADGGPMLEYRRTVTFDGGVAVQTVGSFENELELGREMGRTIRRQREDVVGVVDVELEPSTLGHREN